MCITLCACAYIHSICMKHIHTYMIYTCMYVCYIYICNCLRARAHVHVHARACVCTRARMCAHTRAQAQIYIYRGGWLLTPIAAFLPPCSSTSQLQWLENGRKLVNIGENGGKRGKFDEKGGKRGKFGNTSPANLSKKITRTKIHVRAHARAQTYMCARTRALTHICVHARARTKSYCLVSTLLYSYIYIYI